MHVSGLQCAHAELRCGGSHLQDPTRQRRVMSAGLLREIGIRAVKSTPDKV